MGKVETSYVCSLRDSYWIRLLVDDDTLYFSIDHVKDNRIIDEEYDISKHAIYDLIMMYIDEIKVFKRIDYDPNKWHIWVMFNDFNPEIESSEFDSLGSLIDRINYLFDK